jgi:hypothetical protein
MNSSMREDFADALTSDPGVEGSDYVALVIEWDDEEDEVTHVEYRLPPRAPSSGKIATVVGALVALALATWAVHRLRATA